MLMKLKTLKEINGIESDESGLEIDGSVDITLLKKEAIKWIKQIPTIEVSGVIFSWERRREMRNLNINEVSILISWIKMFFNITEEDVSSSPQ